MQFEYYFLPAVFIRHSLITSTTNKKHRPTLSCHIVYPVVCQSVSARRVMASLAKAMQASCSLDQGRKALPETLPLLCNGKLLLLMNDICGYGSGKSS
jgi:hypothetical protein